MNELLLSIKKFLGNDENVLAFVVGVFEKEHFTLCYQHGIFVATTRRLLFYGKFPYYPSTFKEYSYLHIESIDFRPYFEFTCNHETIRAKYIQKGNVEQFVRIVRANVNN
ncbi:PH domain-containing protein [Bacillus pacificus]|uniref:PH domain-containing protein n=1 Tax=Bacillus cereus group TaxID=86661 RepID=UPI00077244FF|nr:MULTISPECIES: PH domain-containing protein [Bacillus cereus group]KXI50912.1 translation initiation factor, aIF-2BI [Bacillus cereus]MCC2351792.1 PH domain-containing protein [Bacillus pacificus]MCC2466136.1 PH domain-containing protein [Bacillus pacificus]MCU5246326.1 PH domain-containing protein [Bacillus pacificus]MCU5363801.1 PH domain-containing protein [Bacillus pacificus]